MGEVIAILNQKGGCGKTTSAVNLSTALALNKRNILLVDIDPQGNATTSFGIEKNELENTIYTTLTGKNSIEDAVIPTGIEGLNIVPSNISLSGAEIELSGEIGFHSILKEKLESMKDAYDYIFIDVPPSLGVLTINSLVAADSVIIPIQAEFYALEGIADLIEAMELVGNRLDSPSTIKGILLTLYDSRTRLGRDVYSNVVEYFEGKENIFKTTIPRNVKLAEAPSHAIPCLIYDEECKGSIAYMELAEELMDMEDE
ncbi:MAG: ParA family protein [Methanobacterium sp.]|uniref:ParA family protein n=1 Tax=Methanobacterium sp. TaxID=2164 RepID=UPI003D652A06|nr:ParA family protein [Methanobacterium sp.]